MSANHTPGRLNFHNNSWQVSTVYNADGKMVAQCLIDEKATEETQFDFEQIKEANARRIVACWNACAGLDTELLENSVAFGVTVNNRFDSKRTELRQFHIDVAALRAENEQLRDHIRTLHLPNVKQKPVCHLDGANGTSFAVYALPPDAEAYKKKNEELRKLLMSAAAKLQAHQRLIESIWVTEDDLHILSKIESALESDEP